MAEIIYKYLAILGITDTGDNPSSIVRKTECNDPLIRRLEICNPRASWREDNALIRYFMGLDSSGYSIKEDAAKKIIDQWRVNWPENKDAIKGDDLKI